MKRRRFIQTLAAVPVVAVPGAAAEQTGTPGSSGSQEEAARLQLSSLDAAAEPIPHFFNAQEFSALRRLSDILMPPLNEMPGALAARTPEFLDFLIGASPVERKQLYTGGLGVLNAQSRRRFGKPFAEIGDSQAVELLAPLKQPWTYEPPADTLTRFLREAKQDVRTATMNSREYTLAASSEGRRGGGQGLYWYPID